VCIDQCLYKWTAGLLKSTLHRVIFPATQTESQDRYSLAYFCHPLDDALLETVPSALVHDHAAKGKASGRRTADGKAVMTAKDHLMERLSATYSVGK
jgi:isopenicillin N synthase-like dioxygenase